MARQILPNLRAEPRSLWATPAFASPLLNMNSKTVFRLSAVAAVITLLGIASPATAQPAVFQSLTSPATSLHNPGKLIWADLFTTDPEAATKFYCSVFGWTAATLDQKGRTYTVFSNEGRPVAGLAPRPKSKSKRPARWILYASVTDIAATLVKVKEAGGQVRAPARSFPDRGKQAIIADSEDSTLGLLESSSGDPADDEPRPGDWSWFELYAKQPGTTAAFYRQVFGYDVSPDTRTERKDDFLLSSGGLERGGVAPLPDREDAKPGWLGVIRVSHLDAKLTQAVALGGEVLLAPQPVAYESRFAIIADSTGGTVGLVEYADKANPANRP
jgi:predicted enzyme related to lactoylglutathione lyase